MQIKKTTTKLNSFLCGLGFRTEIAHELLTAKHSKGHGKCSGFSHYFGKYKILIGPWSFQPGWLLIIADMLSRVYVALYDTQPDDVEQAVTVYVNTITALCAVCPGIWDELELETAKDAKLQLGDMQVMDGEINSLHLLHYAYIKKRFW